MFTFKDQMGEELFEYPRDATHWGGRIVGELEIDFVRVSHQKDSFDKLDPEWKEVVKLVRGESPMQPNIAQRMGMAKNTSPLARLFAGYRKGKAGLKSLVPGDTNGVGINAGIVSEYVERFYKGESAFKNDAKWFELVEQAEIAMRGGTGGADEAAGEFPILGLVETSTQEEEVINPSSTTADILEAPELDHVLSGTYEIVELQGSPVLSVKAFRHSEKPSGKEAYTIQPDGYRVRFDYYAKHSHFVNSLESPLDCLIVDLAHHFLTVSATSPREIPVSKIARILRSRFWPNTDSEVDAAADRADSEMNELRTYIHDNLPKKAPLYEDALAPHWRDEIERKALRAESADEKQVTAMIQEGHFAQYLSSQSLLELIELWPDIILDGKYFDIPFSSTTMELQKESVSHFLSCLKDVQWLADEASGTVSKDVFWRLSFSRSLASLLLVEYWKAD